MYFLCITLSVSDTNKLCMTHIAQSDKRSPTDPGKMVV